MEGKQGLRGKGEKGEKNEALQKEEYHIEK